jgi:hypothetical protein
MATHDAPSWLTPEETSAPAPAVPEATASDKVSAINTAQQEIDDRELPGIILAMRLANMGVSIALMTVSVSVDPRNAIDRTTCMSLE